MKYLCLAYEEETPFAEMTVEEWQALRNETLAYVEQLRASGHLLATHPLGSASKAATVRIRSGKLSVTDGPFIETKEQIGGYFLIEAADFDEALQIAAKWPSARIGNIEVRPVDDGLAMDKRYR
jgi:hypothetical protein